MKTKLIVLGICSMLITASLSSCVYFYLDADLSSPYKNNIYVINKSSYDITLRSDWYYDDKDIWYNGWHSWSLMRNGNNDKILRKESKSADQSVPSVFFNQVDWIERYCLVINDSVVVQSWYDNDAFEEGQHHFYNDDAWKLVETHDEYEHTFRSWYFTITDDDLNLE